MYFLKEKQKKKKNPIFKRFKASTYCKAKWVADEDSQIDLRGEFLSKEFATFCEESNIKRQLSTSYILQQNVMVKRKNWSLMEMGKNHVESQNSSK